MRPDVVVDIGNTRIKWGRVSGRDIAEVVRLGDDVAAWDAARARWLPSPDAKMSWLISGVQPARAAALRDRLTTLGDDVRLLDRAALVPLKIAVPAPDKVGIDRLLNAAAALPRLRPGAGAVLIDTGSAVTCDYLDETGTYRGGSISPGLDLMAKSLHAYTALLPEVIVTPPVPDLPANATIPAMQVGIFLAVAGGIRESVRLYSVRAKSPPDVYFTGGQAPILIEGMRMLGMCDAANVIVWPEMTLAGILACAEGA